MHDIAVSSEAQQALTKLLVKAGLIDRTLAENQFASSEHCPIAYFARQGHFEEDEALRVVADRLKIPVCAMDKHLSDSILLLLDHTTLSPISLARWQAIRALPIEIDQKQVVIAFANPLDAPTRKALRFDLGLEIKEVLAKETEILEVLGKKSTAGQLFDLNTLLKNSSQGPLETRAENDLAQLESNISEHDVSAPPIVRLVNRILSQALENNASDIHLSPEKDVLSVKLRVDGIMQPLFAVPAGAKNAIVSRIKLLGGMDIAEKRKPQDGRLRIKTNQGIKDLRLSTVPTLYGENLVARILSADLNHISFEKLGWPNEIQERLCQALAGSSKVILVTGPTGSGKTSSLYASLMHTRNGARNIVTIEDPIEYRVPGINQIQVNAKTGLDFASGLRSVLRQDPDVILIGEIRDQETCSIALQAAQTGHLVLSTLHTNSAAAAVTRMRDLGLPAFLISESVGGILAQRLLRCVCTECSAPVDADYLKRFPGLQINTQTARRSIGCKACDSTGYRGRTGIFSYLEITEPVRAAIRAEAAESEIEDLGRATGFRSLVDAGLDLVNSGATTLEELERTLGVLTTKGDTSAPLHEPKTKNIQTSAAKDLEQDLSKRRILLVEDDENISMVLSLLFEREMFEVEVAQDGVEGLEKLYAKPPHLVVCDLMMPRMNGLEMIKKMRRDGRTKAIPVLMLTAADSERNEIKLLECGADDFVSKTADSKLVLARVHKLINRF